MHCPDSFMQYAAHPHSSRQPQAPPPPHGKQTPTHKRAHVRLHMRQPHALPGRKALEGNRTPALPPHRCARASAHADARGGRTRKREASPEARARAAPSGPRHPQGTLPNPPTHAGARARPHALMLGSTGGGGCSAGVKGCDRAVAATPTVRPPSNKHTGARTRSHALTSGAAGGGGSA